MSVLMLVLLAALGASAAGVQVWVDDRPFVVYRVVVSSDFNNRYRQQSNPAKHREEITVFRGEVSGDFRNPVAKFKCSDQECQIDRETAVRIALDLEAASKPK